jgi:CYTH domain-containing protein
VRIEQRFLLQDVSPRRIEKARRHIRKALMLFDVAVSARDDELVISIEIERGDEHDAKASAVRLVDRVLNEADLIWPEDRRWAGLPTAIKRPSPRQRSDMS